jgi:uroporphyrin-III C-methyltransferase / precorrin-2 dehydrogenase / sirohydrochlorin ferrochelatase
MSAPLLPVFLKLEGRRVLLVGAGRVARGKLDGLLEVGARVTIVAPEVPTDFERPGVSVRRGPFAPSDLADAWLVVAAATREVNHEVAVAAERQRVFVNAVDDPEGGSAYTGGTLRRGGVTLAFSTEGKAPALAGLLREALEAVLPDELEAWVQRAASLRAQWRAAAVPMPNRRPLLLQALNRLYEQRLEEAVP